MRRQAAEAAAVAAGTAPVKRGRGRPRAPWIAERLANPVDPMMRLQDQVLQSCEDIEQMIALEKMLGNAIEVDDFSKFCRGAWHVVEPSTRLEWGIHHQLICCVLQSLFEDWLRGRDDPENLPAIKNCVFNLPPGSLKSRIIAVFFPAWCWLRCPGMKIICLSVNEDATMRDARAARDLIKSPWYQSAFSPTWKLKGDQDAISNYGNSAGGERLSKASGSEIVGLRGDLLLIDDPNNPLTAENQNERDKVNSLWDTNIYNRVNDGLRSMRVGVQQRTNAGDWTGHVILKQGVWSRENPDGWLWVVLPAEFEVARKFVLPEPLKAILRAKLPVESLVMEDWRTSEGESVHPARFTKEMMAAERKRWEGTGNYAGQMQQRPALVEGGAIKRAWFNFCRLDSGVRTEFDGVILDRPRPAHTDQKVGALLIKAAHHRPGVWDFDWLVVSIDCAAKKTERGSNWGILVVAGKAGRRFVLDDRTRRGDILEIIEVLRDLIRLWKPDKILIEDKASGDDFKTMMKDGMSRGDMPMVQLEMIACGTQGKEERLDSCKAVLANGLVHLLDQATWLEEFVEELALFPNGVRNDRVDALTQVLNHYLEVECDSLPDW